MTDPMLQAIVRTVNDLDASVGITLSVQGGTITGYLISAGEYFDAAFEALDGPKRTKVGDKLKNLFSSATVRATDATPEFLHLKEARYFLDADVEEKGALWRGKLSDVSGFHFGVTKP